MNISRVPPSPFDKLRAGSSGLGSKGANASTGYLFTSIAIHCGTAWRSRGDSGQDFQANTVTSYTYSSKFTAHATGLARPFARE
jgi:hypothetical protein